MPARLEHFRALAALGAIALTALFTLGGCARTNAKMAAQPVMHEALVLPSDAMLHDHASDVAMHHPGAAWEYGRNDNAINFDPNGAVRPYGWTETYTRDRFTTYGGRIHDHSRFEIRSYRVR